MKILAILLMLALIPLSYADQSSSVSGAIHGGSPADVTIECLGNEVHTTSDGYYLAFIDCPLGETVTVTATTGFASGTNTGIITYSSIAGVLYGADVDVELQDNPSVPEFPSAIIPALLSIASFGIIRRFSA